MIGYRYVGLVVSVAWMVGCQGNVSDGAATTSATTASSVAAVPSAAPAAAAATPHKSFGHHGGPAGSFLHAAQSLSLTAAQQASLSAIEATLRADDDASHAAMMTFHSDLSAGVKAGTLDTAKLAVDSTAVETAMTDHRAKESAALVSLHALLDPTQRAALVTAVRAKQADHEAQMASWKAKEGATALADHHKKHIDKLTADLALDAAQQQKVAAVFAQEKEPSHAAGMDARHDAMKQHQDALLTAFAGDTFDASQALPTTKPGESAHEPMNEHVVSFVSKILPILHPDQREKFAASMERGPKGDFMQGAGEDAVEAPGPAAE